MPPADVAARVVSRPPGQQDAVLGRTTYSGAEGLTLDHAVEQLAEKITARLGSAAHRSAPRSTLLVSRACLHHPAISRGSLPSGTYSGRSRRW